MPPPPAINDKRLYALSALGAAAATPLVVVFALLVPRDAAGWAVFALTFVVVLGARLFRGEGRLALAGMATLALHQAVSLVNVYGATVPGAEADALDFHAAAAERVAGLAQPWTFTLGGRFYEQFLAASYQLLGGPSLFLGQELSLLAFALSCVAFVRLVRRLELWPHRTGLLLLFGALPSGIVFQSITLRESWQVLFTLLSADAALAVRDRPSLANIFRLLLSSFALAVWHNGLAVYAAVVILAGLYWGTGAERGWGARGRRTVAIALALILIGGWLTLARGLGGASAALASGQALEYADTYRLQGRANARANYGVMLDASSPLGLAQTLPVVLVQYLFAPFPWQVSGVLDLEALAENALRLVLLGFALQTWRTARGEARRRHAFLALLWLVMEFLWALGTINWGTAIRHHLPAHGLLVLMGGPGLLRALNSKRKRS